MAAEPQNTRGLGLGLYISKEIIAAHRGTIGVRSSREAGTCFEIELPKHVEGAPRDAFAVGRA
ncbi:MAG: ATP-binding protein [Acidobacteriota bacterium]